MKKNRTSNGSIIFLLSLILLSVSLCVAAEPVNFTRAEKGRLEVGTAGSGTTSLPLLVALDGGYFAKRGLNVSVNQVGATVAVQGIISGTMDIYQGGTAAIAANLAGADIIYVAAAVDKNSLILFGQKGIAAFENLRGKSIATTFPGAFGEIAVRMTAKKFGMEVGKDFKLLYHRSPAEALSTFLMGNADGLIITPPQTELAKQQGYPVLIDYYKEGLKIVGPGTAVTREFFQKFPNTIKTFLMAYLDGLKRAIDDEAYAKQIESKYTKISDPRILNENYQQGLRVWNKDMTVDPAAIRVVLDDSSDPKAKSADPKRFYNNSLIESVNREYASKLFPGEFK
ncbi:MAG TPA: ABC transporter substrate-binding protein [Candidatus Acidoferrales bacterium]|nr:ABC transporter substrate-binding protein [Candidatus Acidoferrales bacterium]